MAKKFLPFVTNNTAAHTVMQKIIDFAGEGYDPATAVDVLSLVLSHGIVAVRNSYIYEIKRDKKDINKVYKAIVRSYGNSQYNSELHIKSVNDVFNYTKGLKHYISKEINLPSDVLIPFLLITSGLDCGDYCSLNLTRCLPHNRMMSSIAIKDLNMFSDEADVTVEFDSGYDIENYVLAKVITGTHYDGSYPVRPVWTAKKAESLINDHCKVGNDDVPF